MTGGLYITAPVMVLATMLGSNVAAQMPDSIRSLGQGVYTEVQARRGEMVYQEVCAACHQPEVFTQTFLESWTGAPLSMLFDLDRTTMPEDRPSGLDPQQYLDVLAYIFELNGLPPGAFELRAEESSLARILIERRE